MPPADNLGGHQTATLATAVKGQKGVLWQKLMKNNTSLGKLPANVVRIDKCDFRA